jgi:hypothetical protein
METVLTYEIVKPAEVLPEALYLSRLRPLKPRGLPLLAQQTHRLMADLNPLGRYLYRKALSPFPHLILQTWGPPRDRLPEGLLLEGPKVLPRTALREGALYRFYLEAAPLKRARPFAYSQEFPGWLAKQLKGAELVNLRLLPIESFPLPKGGSLLVGKAQGVLRVRDLERFWSVLALGLGRGRAYGLGLLSLGGAR